MSDFTVGKNGIGPPQLAPARILRPGDAGFPGDEEVPSKFRNCEHPGCGVRYLPGVAGLRWCMNHNTPEAAKERDAGMVLTAPEEKRTMASKKHCATCGKEFQATGNAQKHCPACKAQRKPPKASKPKAEKPSAAAAIANLRQKAEAPPQPTGTGKGGDLYQQLSARRAQMLADIEAIDRVLAII